MQLSPNYFGLLLQMVCVTISATVHILPRAPAECAKACSAAASAGAFVWCIIKARQSIMLIKIKQKFGHHPQAMGYFSANFPHF